MVSILLATNRQQKAGNGLPDFGDEPLPENPSSLICGAATVDAIEAAASAAGKLRGRDRFLHSLRA